MPSLASAEVVTMMHGIAPASGGSCYGRALCTVPCAVSLPRIPRFVI